MAIASSTLLYTTKLMGPGFFIFFQTQDLSMPASYGSGSGSESVYEEEPDLDDETFVEVDNRLLDESDISDIIALLELSGLVE